MTSLSQFIDNLIDINPEEDFAAIIGKCPSKGARSPLLWNAVFEHAGMESKMIPLDVSAQNVPLLIDVLAKDYRFIGGAIAVPYKECIAKHPQLKLTNEAALIGSVNALYREQEFLVGANTDGEAAIRALETKFGHIAGKKALIVGLGGVGKAVSIYMKIAVGGSGAVYVTNRSESSKDFAITRSLEWVSYDDFDHLLPDIDILVNCTIIGSIDLINLSPLSLRQLQLLSKKTIVYDVIYNPEKTKLIILAESLGLKTLNGSEMNIEQAALALHKTSIVEDSLSNIKKLMIKKVLGMTIEKNA